MTGIPLPATWAIAEECFSDAEWCHAFLVSHRWPDGVRCPYCGHARPYWYAPRQWWRCQWPDCKRQFSVRTGTALEGSKLPLGTWLRAIWVQSHNLPNGLDCYTLAARLGVTVHTAQRLTRAILPGKRRRRGRVAGA